MDDFCVEGNTYQLPANEITLKLRNLYDAKNGEIKDITQLEDGTIFDELYDFCIGALEVYYAVFKESDRYDKLKNEIERQEVMYHVLSKYNMIDN